MRVGSASKHNTFLKEQTLMTFVGCSVLWPSNVTTCLAWCCTFFSSSSSPSRWIAFYSFFSFLQKSVESFIYGMFAHMSSLKILELGKKSSRFCFQSRDQAEVHSKWLMTSCTLMTVTSKRPTSSRSFTSTFPSSFWLIAAVERINHFMRMNKFNIRYRKSNNFN